MNKCMCDEPLAEVCHVHMTYKVSTFRNIRMYLFTAQLNFKNRFKWWLAKLVLGDLLYYTSFKCPDCKKSHVIEKNLTVLK